MKFGKGITVLGHPRSGTTLLRRLLNLHEAIASPPETHLFSACARFIDRDHTADGVDMGVLSGLNFAGFDDEVVLQELREFAFGFLNRFAERQGKRRWAEKTAFDIFYLDSIERILEDQVFYLGIIRHPLDVAVSSVEFCDAAGVYPKVMHSYIKEYPRPIEAFVNSWIETTQSLLSLGERQEDNCLIVRYEDLVTDTEEVLAQIFSVLGEAFDKSILSNGFSGSEVIGFSDHKSYQRKIVDTESLSKWKGLPSPLISQVAEKLNPLLEVCGYDLLDVEAPISIDVARRRYQNSLLVHSMSQK
ncbi:sulfotransferase family protein [Microbulbifer sp. JMSA004]|uniref:sulfotransferase family protein n=1 Tax=unclassified Microbulbifer TaxID=2619833 RepID=UPI0024AE3808|nr:sulfotransferase [Microbulbifer sp. VAAF005]WHI48264.1 sulfotransferase [Microbulbifer sp. VAAF005]